MAPDPAQPSALLKWTPRPLAAAAPASPSSSSGSDSDSEPSESDDEPLLEVKVEGWDERLAKMLDETLW